MADAVLHEESFEADSLDMRVEKTVLGGSNDWETEEESHCPLEPCVLHVHCQSPCGLEDP